MAEEVSARPTGLDELDRVLSGGLVAGSVSLCGGEPGIGKSTLLLQAAASLAASGGRTLYVAAEEPASQVQARAGRLGALVDGVWVVATAEVEVVVDDLAGASWDPVVVDSVQALRTAERGATPGSTGQVRECAQLLSEAARAFRVAAILIGHVTKDGSLAGPRHLEHLVDTVLSFEGDRHHALRQLRAVKHRFGPTNELGLFEMTETGLAAVLDAGALFLGDRPVGVPGSAVLPAIEGRRPLLVEVQALVSSTSASVPRRSAEGVDAGRLGLLLAVLDKRAGIRLAALDVYTLVVGGARITEPAADLAVLLALVSSAGGRPLDGGTVACGEVGLAGEVRRVPHLPQRLAEAARLGFRRAIVPASASVEVDGLDVVGVRSVEEAVAAAGLVGERRAVEPGRRRAA
jgi:DNA repair protein RadA/Sms